MRPKYSIIYPVLPNSIEFLTSTLSILLEHKRADFEVLISVNGPSTAPAEKLQSDPRVKIVSPGEMLSMNQHYEFALGIAQGTWIQLLGADDFVGSSYFSRLDDIIHESTAAEVITWERAYYFWNSPEEISTNTIDFRLSTAPKYKRLSSYLSLLGVKSLFEMPQLYTCSIVKRSLIEEIRNKSDGCFFHSIAPDIYSSIAILLNSKAVVKSRVPLTWVGTSSKSYGIGNRIYSDLSKSVICRTHEHNKLHSRIILDAHAKNYESLFLMECLLQYASISKQRQLFVEFLITSNFISECRMRKEFTLMREQLKLIKSYNNVVFLLAKITSWLLPFVRKQSSFLNRLQYYLQVKFHRRYLIPAAVNPSPQEANRIHQNIFDFESQDN